MSNLLLTICISFSLNKGGTLSAGIECIKMCGGSVVECACIVELKFFIAQRTKVSALVDIQTLLILRCAHLTATCVFELNPILYFTCF